MAPPAKTFLYCTDADMDELLSALGIVLRFDDDDDGALSGAEAAVKLKARSIAAARVEGYLLGLYRQEELALSWMVNEWATIIACYWASCRRGNTPALPLRHMLFGSGGEDRGAMGEMKDVRAEKLRLEVGLRSPTTPRWTTTRFDDRYGVRKLRVQRQSSENTPAADHPQAVDYISEYPEP